MPRNALELPPARTRLAWIDNLRTFIILLVVNMHAYVTYSHVGSWYVMEEPEPSMPVKVAFLFWQGHLQSFFMGLLFFLSGIFAHSSLQRRGPLPFLRERVIRLCLPALLYMLIIHPFIVFVVLRRNGKADLAENYLNYVISGRFLSGNGPLWFALTLFGFCVCLVLWQRIHVVTSSDTPHTVPGPLKLGAFAILLVLGTFLIRIIQPIGTNIMNFQLCFFPQYIAAFAVGIAAQKHHWVEGLAASGRARFAGCLGLVIGPLLLFAVLKCGGPMPERAPNPYVGGWNPQAFGLAFWEQLTGIALALGLMGVFHRYLNRSTSFATWLSDRSFGVYVLHAPILISITPLLRQFDGSPMTKALILTVLGLVASYAAADIVKRIPGLRAIL